MKYKNWEICGFKRETAVEFCKNGLNPLVSVFLASRGIDNMDGARVMTGDTSGEIHDPMLLADMEKAVLRIENAIAGGERIAVYGDYDVDGMTSCAIMALWLESKRADYEIYIPDRQNEGYGLNIPAIDALKSRGASLIITVDCGVTALAEAEYVKNIGVDLVITDHHECRAQLPEAVAVVDPKRPDCKYPYKYLAGVGVVYKLICALEKGTGWQEVISLYGDLVAIGTIADVMPMNGENRDLIKLGLIALNDKPRPGIIQLLREICPELSKVSASTVGFMLAPRLNAAGRMGQAELSLEFLLADDMDEGERLSGELCRLNNERRLLETSIYEDAIAMLPKPVPDEPIIIAGRGWSQGVTGIVAARLADRYKLPSVVISIDEDGIGRGSCRSFGEFGLYQAIISCEDILIRYGGHETASGVTIAEENIAEFRRRIIETYKENYRSVFEPRLRIDFEVQKSELLTITNIEALACLEPFGNSNPLPSLCIMDAQLTYLQSIGDGKHTRLKILKSGKRLDCIYFSVSADSLGVSEGMQIDIAFEPQVNVFKGRSNVQLNVLDLRPTGN